MAKEEDYKIENIYQGGYSSLDPNKAYSNTYTGYRSDAGSLGLTTDFRTANILQDISRQLATGVKQIEITAINQDIFDSIPRQHLEETKQLSKLTGINVSLHAPLTESTGITQQGFSELNREMAERKITDALLRSHELNPAGNIPVTFHSAHNLPGSEWKTLGDVEGKKPREAKRLIAVDKESGRMIPLEVEKKFYPMRYDERGEKMPVSEKGEIYTPEENLKLQNRTVWDNQLSQLFFNKERADDILQQNYVQIQHLMKDLKDERITINDLTPPQQAIYLKAQDAENYLDDVRKNANALFSKAYQFGTEKQKVELKKISEEFVENVSKRSDAIGVSRATSIMLTELKDPRLVPEMYVPLEKFAVDQSAKTYGNAAFTTYSKFKDPNKTPMMVIENPPAGSGLSTGEDLKNLVIASRNQFVERAKEKGMNEREAEKIAEKLIGATWDVGHINLLRAQGFKAEDIIKETQKIAPYVKHVHLSDNFGMEHTELPMGMGNVPIKEIMEKLGQEGFEGKKIIEAANWYQHFKTSPLKETFEGFGSPMYSFGGSPYWNQSLGLQQGYSSGYAMDMVLPSNNYQTFGAGFSQLPRELGGEMRAGGGRFSQRGME